MGTIQNAEAMVVFESMFGNTQEVARAVADGLEAVGVATTVVDVRSAPVSLPAGLRLLVLGGPTHAFGLSRPDTRRDAVRQGAGPERATTGLREWLTACEHDHLPSVKLAAFDTRVAKVRWLPLTASSAAVRLAGTLGFDVVSSPQGFLVEGVPGPLVGGELARAAAWGSRLGERSLLTRTDAHRGEVRDSSARPGTAP